MRVQHAKARSFDKHITSASVAAGDVKGGQGHVPPSSESCHRMERNKPRCLCATSGGQTDLQVPLPNAFPSVEQVQALLLKTSFRPAPRRGVPTGRLPSCCITHEGSFPPLHDLTKHFPPSQFFLHMIPAVPNSSR